MGHCCDFGKLMCNVETNTLLMAPTIALQCKYHSTVIKKESYSAYYIKV